MLNVAYVAPAPAELFAKSEDRAVADDGKDEAAWPSFEIMRPAEPPRVVLNRPVVLNEEGKVEGEVVEKSLFQK